MRSAELLAQAADVDIDDVGPWALGADSSS
jgi:hypothetical protein